MKCYYEVLNVPRDADDAAIKSSYRKLALKWHPDKNLDNPEEANEQFLLVQQAYDILSDRQERAWYDNHREQILHASNDNFEDKSLDVFQYFTASCFKGYGDDGNGFYSVYRKVFEQIANEDIEFMEGKKDMYEIPTFGTSASDYETVVAPFYVYWTSYSTKKSYVWLDPYKVTEIKGGKMLKLVEKENKKVRQKAKKERNEEVRNLVAFVRKRDKRVQAYVKLQESKKLENRKKQEQISLQRRRERQMELNQSGNQADWTKFDNVQSELEQIERQIAEEFGATDSEDEHSLFNNNLYCIACKKLFRKEKAFQAHESTNKHKDNVEKLRSDLLETQLSSDEMQCSDGSPSADIESHDGQESDNHISVDSSCETCAQDITDENRKYVKENNDNEEPESSAEQSDLEVIEVKRKSKKKKKKQNILKAVNSDDENDIPPIIPVVADNFDFNSSDKQKRKNSKKVNKVKPIKKVGKDDTNQLQEESLGNSVKDIEQCEDKPENCDDVSKVSNPSNGISLSKKKQPKTVNKKGKKQPPTSQEDGEVDANHCCATCKSVFPSKNKLFEHLKKTGHSVYLPQIQTKHKNKQKK